MQHGIFDIHLRELIDLFMPRSIVTDPFLSPQEQFTSMLQNVTKNRKCHHHLASKDFVNYLIQIFNSQFYSKYTTTAASIAHRATIKNIMHVLTRLMDDSQYGRDLSVDNNIAAIIRSLQENSFLNSTQGSSMRSSSELDIPLDQSAVSETKSLSRQNSGDVPKKPRITLGSRKLSVNSSSAELFL